MSEHPVISLTDIHKTYRLGDLNVEVLKGIDLDIMPGEFAALTGPSGSGKSTLLHIMGMLDRPTQGRYLLNGRDVSGLDDDELSRLRNRTTGFLFQSFYLVPYATAQDNVMLPGLYGPGSQRAIKKRAQELLDQVGLSDRAGFKPSQLSGGQQQRVALARALMNDPEVILADEPTGQLDTGTSKEIMDLFARINSQGRTIILVTHDSETASYAGRRIHLEDGRIKNA